MALRDHFGGTRSAPGSLPVLILARQTKEFRTNAQLRQTWPLVGENPMDSPALIVQRRQATLGAEPKHNHGSAPRA